MSWALTDFSAARGQERRRTSILGKAGKGRLTQVQYAFPSSPREEERNHRGRQRANRRKKKGFRSIQDTFRAEDRFQPLKRKLRNIFRVKGAKTDRVRAGKRGRRTRRMIH